MYRHVLTPLFARQLGLATRAQALEVGLSPRQLHRMISRGDLVAVHCDVVRHPAAPRHARAAPARCDPRRRTRRRVVPPLGGDHDREHAVPERRDRGHPADEIRPSHRRCRRPSHPRPRVAGHPADRPPRRDLTRPNPGRSRARDRSVGRPPVDGGVDRVEDRHVRRPRRRARARRPAGSQRRRRAAGDPCRPRARVRRRGLAA